MECYDLQGNPALQFIMPFGSFAGRLNQPISIPFSGPMPPPYWETVDGVRYESQLTGTATFSQVDPEHRAFVARLTAAKTKWIAQDGKSFYCEVPEGPFWAVQGDFL